MGPAHVAGGGDGYIHVPTAPPLLVGRHTHTHTAPGVARGAPARTDIRGKDQESIHALLFIPERYMRAPGGPSPSDHPNR